MKPPLFKSHSFVFFLGIYCFLTTSCLGQQNNGFWEHVRFGGGVGLGFGSGYFSGTLAPSAIYEFNDPFAAGIGLNGTYYSRKDYYKAIILGGSLIGLYNPISEIQLSAEFEELHVSRDWDRDYFSFEDDDYWYPALWLGGGYRAQNITVGVRYDVLYDTDRSIHGTSWTPFVRVYF